MALLKFFVKDIRVSILALVRELKSLLDALFLSFSCLEFVDNWKQHKCWNPIQQHDCEYFIPADKANQTISFPLVKHPNYLLNGVPYFT